MGRQPPYAPGVKTEPATWLLILGTLHTEGGEMVTVVAHGWVGSGQREAGMVASRYLFLASRTSRGLTRVAEFRIGG